MSRDRNPRPESGEREGTGSRPHGRPRPREASCSLSFPIRGAEDAGARCSGRAGAGGWPPAAGPSPLPGSLAKGECHRGCRLCGCRPAHPCAEGLRVTVTNAPLPAVGSEGPCPHRPQSAPHYLFGVQINIKITDSVLAGYELGQDVSFPGCLGNAAPDAQEMAAL